MKHSLLIASLLLSVASAKAMELTPRTSATGSLKIVNSTVLFDGRNQVSYLAEVTKSDGQVVEVPFVVRTKSNSRVINEFETSGVFNSVDDDEAMGDLGFNFGVILGTAFPCFGIPNPDAKSIGQMLTDAVEKFKSSGKDTRYRKLVKDAIVEFSIHGNEMKQVARIEKVTRQDYCVIPK